jgi:uroporphyrinogen-III synthase
MLKDYCERSGIQLYAHSLIDFELVSNRVQTNSQVVFFSSIRTATFFLESNRISNDMEIATIGEQTAQKLNGLGLEVDFIGSTAGDPETVASDFRHWLNGRRVLIPCSDRSNRSIATALPKNQVEELVVYKTIPASITIEPCDLYVFSSPSNVESFLLKNNLPEKSFTIAWGKTTEKALVSQQIFPDLVLKNSSEIEVIAFLEEKK